MYGKLGYVKCFDFFFQLNRRKLFDQWEIRSTYWRLGEETVLSIGQCEIGE